MKKPLSLALLGLVGLVTLGLLSLQTTTVNAGFGDEVSKREDDVAELVLVDDDDDDDSNDDSSTFTGFSRSTNDNTRSNFTKVSRDRDLSRSDKTRDWTRDGKSDRRKRDWSANRTNDRSRNDTRG